jgi:hypothetical protein
MSKIHTAAEATALGDQASLRQRKLLPERGVGLLKLGDLALQTVDFREEHGDVFGLDCFCGADSFSASPVAEAAAI